MSQRCLAGPRGMVLDCWFLACSVSGLGLATTAQAQDLLAPGNESPTIVEAAAVVPPATQSLDLNGLLTESLVVGGNLNGPVWQLDDVDGRSPLLIPIRLTPGQAATEFDDPAVSLAGARFVGWWVPETAAVRSSGRSRSANRGRGFEEFADQPRFVAGDSRFAHLLGDPNADPSGGALREPEPAIEAEPAVPGPRLARSVTVTPDGRVTWEMDRSFQGASLRNGDNLYLLKLDPLRLREQQPEAPQRLSRNGNETTAEYNLRRREAQQAFRDEQQAYRALRESVQDLPETFEASLGELPGQVAWAVFLKQDRRPALGFEGDAEGLPWSVDLAAFDVLRGSGGRNASATDADPIATMKQLVERGDALSMRAVAIALTGGTNNGFRDMAVGDPTYRLTQQLVLGRDAPAARTAIDALAAVDPPTDASRRLLDIAAQTDDPLAKLAALRASLRSSADNPAAVARILQQAVAVLTDPAGPPPEEVLAALAGTHDTASTSRRRGAGAPANAIPALAIGVPFESIPLDRQPSAVRWVLQHASDPEGLPAAWLDTKLLGGGNDGLLRETLNQLATAEVVWPEDATPVAVEPPSASASRSFREFVFGRSSNTPEATEASAEPAAPTLFIAPIALTSPDHGLIEALQHPETDVRATAWSVLPKFTLGGSNSRTDAGPTLTAVVAAAPTPTPETLVPFLGGALRGNGTSQAATAALMQLAGSGDVNASAQAVTTLLTPGTDRNGQPRRLNLRSGWQDLDPDARAGFAGAVYRSQRGSDTPVASLAGHDRAGTWFIQQLEAGDVPPAGDWVEPLGGESQAIDLAGGPDDAIAHGALAALAAAVGADADAQRAIIERFGEAPRSADDLQVAWPDVQRELIVAQLEDAAGEYRLLLVVRELQSDTPTDPTLGVGFDVEMEGRMAAGIESNAATGTEADASEDDGETPAEIVPANYVLGVVELTVADGRVALVGDPVTLDVPDTFAALRIAEPKQLRNFPSPELASLPLDQATAPIDLRREPQGDWVGATAFGPDHELEVRMEPAE